MSKKVLEPEYLIPPLFDADGVQVSSGIGVDGREYPDPVPMAPPVGYEQPPDIMTLIKRMVRSEELRRLQENAGFETFEEADDFDVEDDPVDPLTPYEEIFYPKEAPPAPPASAPPVSPPPQGVAASPEGQVSSPAPVNGSTAAQSST